MLIYVRDLEVTFNTAKANDQDNSYKEKVIITEK